MFILMKRHFEKHLVLLEERSTEDVFYFVEPSTFISLSEEGEEMMRDSHVGRRDEVLNFIENKGGCSIVHKIIVNSGGRAKVCVQCKSSDVRYPSGETLKSKYMCSICEVSLCKSYKRRSFEKYHSVKCCPNHH